MNLVALFLLLAALFALGACSEKHSRLTGLNPDKQKRLTFKLVGFGLMLLSLVVSIIANGPSIGALIWFTLSTPCAAVTLLALTYRPRLVPLASLICCVAALGGGLASYLI